LESKKQQKEKLITRTTGLRIILEVLLAGVIVSSVHAELSISGNMAEYSFRSRAGVTNYVEICERHLYTWTVVDEFLGTGGVVTKSFSLDNREGMFFRVQIEKGEIVETLPGSHQRM